MRYIISIIAVIIFVVIAIIIIATSGSHAPANKPGVNLVNYNYPGTSVSQTTEGELVGEDQREAVRVTVTQSLVEVDILSGYEENITNTEKFANTPAGYEAFLQGLELAGFIAGRTTTEKYMLGVCPEGQIFTYILKSPTKTVTNYWGTSCDSGDGTFAGNASLVQQLFQMQVSNYQNFTESVNLSYQ